VRIVHTDENGKKEMKFVRNALHGVLSVMCMYNKDQVNGHCGSCNGAKFLRMIDLQFKERVKSGMWNLVLPNLFCK
jgi:hypothetical protein